MGSIHEKLQSILPEIHSLKEIGISKQLAKFGDSVTNLAYSIAKSMEIGHLDARTVNQIILSNALKNSGMRIYAKTRSDAHALADTAEAFIGYVYCNKIYSLEDIAKILHPKLMGKNLNLKNEENQAGIEAFTDLLQQIKLKLEPLFE